MEQHGPAVLTMLKTAEIAMGEFLLPWGMVISALGFLAAWLVVFILEQFRLTRFLWNLPLFFIALSVLLGSVIGIILSP
jgi:ABC-type multidrug transport system permease subunit